MPDPDAASAAAADAGVSIRRGLLTSAVGELRAVITDHERRWPTRDRVLDGWRRSGAVRELAGRPELREAASEFLGVRAFPFQTLNFRRGSAQPLHADAVHFDTLPAGGVCGVWVALEDVGEHQGPLEYVPGSHTDGFTERYLRGATAPFDDRAYEQALADHLDGRERRWFRASAGDVLVWDGRLAHGGRAVEDPAGTRWSQVIHFFREDAVYTTPRAGVGLREGEFAVREPVVDLSTGRRVRPGRDGVALDVLQLTRGRAVVLGPDDPPAPRSARLGSTAIRLRRRVAWRLGDRGRAR